MINYKEELNPAQHDVIQNGDGHCLVLAGAGSGKTRTIAYRVAYLLEQGVPPDALLLVTFTNKAAREMKERIAQMGGGGHAVHWAGTFHHIAFRILKRHANLIGFQSSFAILDQSDSIEMMKLCLKAEGINRKVQRFPSARVLQSIISFSRNAERALEDVLNQKYPQWAHQHHQIGRIAEDYRKRKHEAQVMDFDDLLGHLYGLFLKHPHVKERYATQFRYVFVDEYQDTNRIQASLMQQFASGHQNLLVVGDDAQSIYSFRAANIDHILSFEKHYPDAKVFKLETNYRSTPEILALANDVIGQNEVQHEKTLTSVSDSAAKPSVLAFATAEEEALKVTQEIEGLIDDGTAATEIAVLFRASFHSQALEIELVRHDIPYEYRGGQRFFERAHIKDILAFLRAWQSPRDFIAWQRILLMQTGIGPVAVQKLLLRLHDDDRLEQEWPFSAEILREVGAGLSARARVGWHEFISMWEAMHDAGGSVDAMVEAIADSSYQEYLQSEYPNYRDRLQDIAQLAVFASKAEDLSTFLAEATLQESYRPDDAGETQRPKIILSTIHQSKGLEWDAVFVIHLAAGQFPNDRALEEKGGLEEERRLLYVAVTRAKRFLQLSYPVMTRRSQFVGGPSVFIEEMDTALIQESYLDESHAYKRDPFVQDYGQGLVFQSKKSTEDLEALSDDDVVYVPE